MEKKNQSLIITIVVVGIALIVTLALVFTRSESVTETPAEGNASENGETGIESDANGSVVQPAEYYQPAAELEKVMMDAGFVCNSETYADLNYATEEITSAITSRLADAGIADEEIVFCDHEPDSVVIAISLPNNVEKLIDAVSDFVCETGEKLAGVDLEENQSVLLIGEFYHFGNTPEDTALLVALLDQNEIDYEEHQLSSKECETEA